MKKKTSYKMGVGISSLLLVLVVISITTLSVLALLSANGDLKLSEKRQEYVRALAEADCLLEETLFKLSEGTPPEDMDIQGITLENIEGSKWMASVPFYGDMQLHARVNILENGIERRHYEIINAGEYEPESPWNFPY